MSYADYFDDDEPWWLPDDLDENELETLRAQDERHDGEFLPFNDEDMHRIEARQESIYPRVGEW